MPNSRPSVMLVESDPQIRQLNELILGEAGFRAAELPLNADPVDFAARTRPSVVLVDAGPTAPEGWRVVDRLRADPRTAAIPVVVIAMSKDAAIAARAAPNVPVSVVAPYDIDALDLAIASAIGKPPPAAILPALTQPPPAAVDRAGDVLSEQSRAIILRVLQDLRVRDVYRERFAELSPSLIDELPTIIGAMIDGMRRNLSPTVIVGTSRVAQALRDHCILRRGQGIELPVVIDEYQTIQHQMLATLRGWADREQVTGADAIAVADRLDALFDEVTVVSITDYLAAPSPTPARNQPRTPPTPG